LAASSMIVNDYHDRAIDEVNEPERPIPSGLVTPREALAFASATSLVGFAAAYFTSLSTLALAVIAWAALAVYTTVGKRSGLPGNFLVSTCVAIPFVYGSLAVTDAVGTNVLLLASMAFLSNTGREITKGIIDVEGDQLHDVKTLAVRYGTRNAAIAAVVFYMLAVSLSPLPWFLRLVSHWFIVLVAIADLGLVASSVALLRGYSREKARMVKKSVLLWFMIGLSAFLAGSLS